MKDEAENEERHATQRCLKSDILAKPRLLWVLCHLFQLIYDSLLPRLGDLHGNLIESKLAAD